MIGLEVVYWVFIIFFGLIGALRGWTKEIVATAGLVLSLFALDYFGPTILNVVGFVDPAGLQGEALDQMYRRQFWSLTGLHIFIAFWSYQGPTVGGRRGGSRSDNVQDKLLGWIIGSLNGYFIIGTIYSFLEFRIGPRPDGTGWDYFALPAGQSYPFSPATIIRPGTSPLAGLNVEPLAIFEYLPLEFFTQNQVLLPLMLVALFLVILIVII